MIFLQRQQLSSIAQNVSFATTRFMSSGFAGDWCFGFGFSDRITALCWAGFIDDSQWLQRGASRD